MIRFAAFILLAALASATELVMVIVKQPLYLHGSDSDVQIRIVDVPVAYSTSYPESYFAAIHLPFTPATNGSWKHPTDVNMASVYGIKVSASVDSAKSVPEWKITIDASAAKQPDGYPFTIEQVIDATMTCIKVMCPPKPESEHKITIDVVRPKKLAVSSHHHRPPKANKTDAGNGSKAIFRVSNVLRSPSLSLSR